MKKVFTTFLVTLLAMTALCGCAGGTEASSEDKTSKNATYGGTVVVGIQQDIDGLDPHKVTAAGTKEILFNIFEGLVKCDENGDLTGAVAENYTLSDDGLTYTFNLRPGVKFHNGNTVTAEDVKYSLERASGLLDGTPLVSTLSAITAVDIVDEKTVRVSVGSVNPELIYSFTTAIIPNGSGEDSNADPIGTGPFRFVSYTPQEGIVVQKNEDYYIKGVPYLDEVDFKIVTSAETALMELRSGTIQIYPYLTDSEATEIQSEMQVLAAPSAVVQALFINNDVEPLNDPKVRQAICYAINREEVSGFVAGGDATIISSAMLPTLSSYYEDLNGTYGLTGDQEKAKQLLAEAGYPDGFDLTITIPSNYEFHMETGEVVAEQLKAVGINAKIDAVEWNTWLSDVYTDRKYETTICGITGDMTPGYLLNRFVSDSPKNFINFNSPEYDSVYANVLECKSMGERGILYKELQKILVDNAGTAFLQVPALKVALANNLGGYKFYPVYVQDMSSVYYTK
ncbi:MAG: ABC transporter substrate-binding protein [Lachnospiraceae bacterium]|nr:ABC transporter substrate-binding protein [Lachnospiraceae bacterium]